MAIFHLSAKIISRSTGRSAVAAAAYRSASKIFDNRTGLSFDYTHKKEVSYQKLLLPLCVPTRLNNRSNLWNAAEQAEVRKDAQVAREIEVALPLELSHSQQIQLLETFIQNEFVSKGMIADVCLHSKPGNPHAHILVTTREVSELGFGKKNRSWNSVGQLQEWRGSWAKWCNLRLSISGNKERIDSRSLAAQNLDRLATIHVGQKEHAMHQKGIYSFRTEVNQKIKETNMKKNEAVGNETDLTFAEELGPTEREIKETKKARFLFLNASDTENQQRYWLALFDKNYIDRVREMFGEYVVSVDGVQTEIGFAYQIILLDGIVLDYGSQIKCDSDNSYEVNIAVRLAKEKGWKGMHLTGSEAFKEAVYIEAILSGAFCSSQLFGYKPTADNIEVIRDFCPAMVPAISKLAVPSLPDGKTGSAGSNEGNTSVKNRPKF